MKIFVQKIMMTLQEKKILNMSLVTIIKKESNLIMD